MLRHVIALILFLSLANFAFSQNLFNRPESVVFDEPRNRYLVSNYGNGDIIQVSLVTEDETEDTLSEKSQLFYSGFGSAAGLHIIQDTLYCATDLGFAAIDLNTKALLFILKIPEAGFLNDITSDSSGACYVSDHVKSQIFKVDVKNQTYSLFASSGLQYPNGILMDETNNRILVCSCLAFGPIKGVSLSDGSVTLVKKTNLHGHDGLARDKDGLIYLSVWGTNAVYRFESSLSTPKMLFSKGHQGPGDIFINTKNNILAVPNVNSNTVEFIRIPRFRTKNG